MQSVGGIAEHAKLTQEGMTDPVKNQRCQNAVTDDRIRLNIPVISDHIDPTADADIYQLEEHI